MDNLFDGGTSWDENETYICNTLNKTSLFTKAYNGIPETLILNVIAWLLLIVLFSTLRHQAGDYGRLALVNDHGNRKRWTEVFYSRSSSSVEQQRYSPNGTEEMNVKPTTSAGATGNLNSSGGADNCIWEQNQTHSSDTTPLSRTNYDQGALSWILITLKLQNSQILTHTGPDAVYYLSFQKHLMLVMSIVTAVSLLIILPINFFGGSNSTEFAINAFGRTTMANLPPDSTWLWAHVIVSIIYAPLIVLIMRRSSGRNAFKTAPTRSIMITNISKTDRNDTVIRNYIQELFPDVNIDRVEVAYNISKLIVHNGEYERALEARTYCEKHRDRDSLTVRSKLCSCKKENAYEFYLSTERDLSGHIARLQASAFNEPLGIAFLTVSTVQEAQNIVAHFTSGTYRQWSLTFAPTPDDIFWENLSVSRSHWLLKWALVNITLFVILFFLTTPAMIVNIWDSLSQKNITALSPIVSDFLSTFILWILSILLPVIVTISDKWMCHYTRSKQNYSIMTKCFAYLLFMILILPSLGLTSAQALLEWSVSNNTMRWQCIFLPDRGSFYINYVITSGFIGTAMELLRFPELIVYTWMLVTAKSKAETPYIRRSILIEFPFGSHYAWTTLIFTISIVYSIFCPLIMPFAMIYICFKHFADRHNLYFAYGPSNMISRNGGKIHSTAVTMTKFSVVILLLVMAMISAIRGAGMARAVVLIITLVITLTLFTFMSPIKRCTQPRRNSLVEVADPAPIYIPDVLKKHKHKHYHSIAMHSNPYFKYSNGRNGRSAVADNNFRAYGSGSVSDFDVSSQNSINSADA